MGVRKRSKHSVLWKPWDLCQNFEHGNIFIMFMLVVSMDPEYGEKAQIPQPNPKETSTQPQARTIVIQVNWTAKDQLPSVRINQDDVRWEDLESQLTRIYLTRVEKVAFVRGDADVDFQYVASVIDLAHHAGVQRIGLMTQEQSAEK
jgi:biopolymer transport protein ExbD